MEAVLLQAGGRQTGLGGSSRSTPQRSGTERSSKEGTHTARQTDRRNKQTTPTTPSGTVVTAPASSTETLRVAAFSCIFRNR